MPKDSDKTQICHEVADVQIEVEIPEDGCFLEEGEQTFVRLVLPNADSGSRLYVFDHRPETVQAVRAINKKTQEKDRQKAEEALLKAVQQPAAVSVMEKRVGKDRYPYINLFPLPNGKEPTALLTTTTYFGGNNGFAVEQDSNAHWSWTSQTSSRNGHLCRIVLCTLTDKFHTVTIREQSSSKRTTTVIGHDIQKRSEED